MTHPEQFCAAKRNHKKIQKLETGMAEISAFVMVAKVMKSEHSTAAEVLAQKAAALKIVSRDNVLAKLYECHTDFNM